MGFPSESLRIILAQNIPSAQKSHPITGPLPLFSHQKPVIEAASEERVLGQEVISHAQKDLKFLRSLSVQDTHTHKP